MATSFGNKCFRCNEGSLCILFDCRLTVVGVKCHLEVVKSLPVLHHSAVFGGGLPPPKFTIRNFYNPSSQNCKPNNFLKSSSILTLMSFNSAFKHVSLLHSDNYKERPNIQNKENFKLLKK